MTLLYMDGFETQDSSRYLAGSTIGFSSSGTRLSYGYCVDVNRPVLRYAIGSNQTTLITGIALKTNGDEFGIYFDGDSGATNNVTVVLNSTGAVALQRNNTVLATSSSGVFSTTGWFYVEVKAVIDDSTGSVDCRINGVSVVSASGVDTRQSTSTGCDTIRWEYRNFGGNRQIDDLYLCNGSGSTNNNFLGDCRVALLYPNGNGASSQLTGSDGNSTDNYLLVDEQPFSTSDYNESGTSGHRDTYTMTNTPGGVTTIYGVQQVANVLKTDAGAKSFKHVIRSGGTNYASSGIAAGTSWQTYLYIREQDPNTSAAWTTSGLDNHEAGIEIV